LVGSGPTLEILEDCITCTLDYHGIITHIYFTLSQFGHIDLHKSIEVPQAKEKRIVVLLEFPNGQKFGVC
jgi:uncharacterized metal-binding protein